MNLSLKHYLLAVGLIILGYFSPDILTFLRYNHAGDWSLHKKYSFLFKDGLNNQLDSQFNFSLYTDKDVYNVIHLNGGYTAIIWEFKNMSQLTIDSFKILKPSTLPKFQIKSGEVLNYGSELEITIKHNHDFGKCAYIYLDEWSTLSDTIQGVNYAGFLGMANYIWVTDNMQQGQIAFDYRKGPKKTLFLLLKKDNSNYLIVVNGKKDFDKTILKTFNLN